MPDRDDRAYFESRARQERAIASVCEDNTVALAHLNMAGAYERRALAAHAAVPPTAQPDFR